jgi:hypothetical protein
MQYTAIIFDLFSTLVGDFSRTRYEYEDVYMRMAGEVHIPYDVFSHALKRAADTLNLPRVIVLKRVVARQMKPHHDRHDLT